MSQHGGAKPITVSAACPATTRGQPTPFEVNPQLNADAKVGGKRQVSRVFIIAPNGKP